VASGVPASSRPGEPCRTYRPEASQTQIGALSAVQPNANRPIRRILVPTDFSAESDEAVSQALTLANQFNASLTLLHVIDVSTPSPMGEAGDFMNELWQQGSARIGRLACRISGGADAQMMLAEGLPWEVIVEKSCDFDLVVVARHRSRAFGSFFSQDTAQRVVEHSVCPVMVVQPQL